MQKNRSFLQTILLLSLTIMLAACVGSYETRTQPISGSSDISLAEATRIAAQAMQDNGFWPKQQHEASGTLLGERTQKINLGWETVTLTLSVQLKRTPSGSLFVDAVCTPSSNIAFWTEGGKCVSEFEQAFRQRMTSWHRAVAPASSPDPKPAPVTPQPSTPERQEYDL